MVVIISSCRPRLLILSLLAHACSAFTPQPFLTTTSTNNIIASATSASFSGSLLLPPFLISDGDDAAVLAAMQSVDDSKGGGVIGILKNVAIGIGVIVGILAAISIVASTVIIPAAAKELEQECKELAPELWEEYQLKLEPGQTIGQRPDLIQELGIKLQPLLDAKIEKQFSDAKQQGIDVSDDEAAWNAVPSMASSSSSSSQSSSSSSDNDGPEPVIVDVSNVGTNQWDDDDDDEDSSSTGKK